MSGVATIYRRQRHERRGWNRHITKAEHIDAFLGLADSLAQYADQPKAAEEALKCLDRVDELRISPRAGWYPARPKAWHP